MFRPYNQNQPMLLPLSVRDCLSEDHFCFVLSDIVDSLDLSSVKSTYHDNGSPAYHPALMIKILFYAYTIGIRSSRKIEASLYENNVMRFLSGNEQMDHGTINLFRKNHLNQLPVVFAQIVVCAGKLGVADLSEISIDGTKIKADASRDMLFAKEDLEKLKGKITAILKEAEDIDTKEDLEFGERRGYNQIPEDLINPEVRREKIRKWKEELDQINKADKEIDKKQDEAKDKEDRSRINKKTVNLTDLDSSMMEMKDKSFKMAYNCQLAASSQLITGYGIIDSANDSAGLTSMIKETEKNTGQKINTVKLDSGYFSKDNIKFIEENNIDAFIPDRAKAIDEREDKNEKNITNKFNRKYFTYDKDKDELICPKNRRLRFLQKVKDKGRKYIGCSCTDCPSKGQCTNGKARIIQVDFELEQMKKDMRAKLNSEAGKKKYDERITEIEPVFANLKHNLGFTKFSCRGKKMVSIELGLISSAHNLIKIFHWLKRNAKGKEQLQWNSLMRLKAVI